jgi:signal transduction histidine kinase
VRLGLRWRIVLLTALAPALLTVGVLVLVHRNVSSHVRASVDESLLRSSSMFEDMLLDRARALRVTADVIARDPRFFAILTVPGSWRDARYRATVQPVARDFASLTRSDLFEVFDRDGHRLASVGAHPSQGDARQALVRGARRGPVSGILVEPQAQYQVALAPVVVDGRVAGVLMLGTEIGQSLARDLRALSHSEITFVSGDHATGSTLASADDRDALVADVQRGLDARGTTVMPAAGGGAWLTLAHAIPGSPPGGRQLYVMQRSLDPETAFVARMRASLVQLGGLAALAALIVALFVAARITGPVLQLVRGAEEMERGNYEHPIEVRRSDEIGYLADRFVDMRRHQRDMVQSLEEIARLKSEFIDVASHELRTPISVLKGFGDLFQQGVLGAVNDQQREALARMDESVGMLARIAEDATRMAHIEGGRLVLERATCEVKWLVDRAIAEAYGDAPGRKVKVRAQVEPGLLANVDGQRLAQALAQLLRNGIRFTPDGGEVAVIARAEGDALLLRVRDTGVGISAERLPQLFGRPVVVRDALHHHSSGALAFNSAGLGLGLAIARGIVEAHGGTIRAESRLGEGSTFELRVPGAVALRAAA